MKAVTLIIPTFNRPLSLLNLLSDLNKTFRHSELFKLKVIIGNNGNHFSIFKKHKFPIQLINNEKNIGGAANVIKLVLETNSDIIITMGDDDKIEGSLFEAIELILATPNEFGAGFLQIGKRAYLNDFSCEGKKYKLMMRGLSLSGLIFNGEVREKLTQDIQRLLIESHYPQLGLLLLCTEVGPIRLALGACVLVNQKNKKYWQYDFSFFNHQLFQMLRFIDSRSMVDEKSWREFVRQRARSLFIAKAQESCSLYERLVFVSKIRRIPEFRYNRSIAIYSIGYILLGWMYFVRRRHGL